MKEKIREIVNNINEKYEDHYVQDIVSSEDLKIIADYIINLEENNQAYQEELCRNWDIRDNLYDRIFKAVDLLIHDINFSELCDKSKIIDALLGNKGE